MRAAIVAVLVVMGALAIVGVVGGVEGTSHGAGAASQLTTAVSPRCSVTVHHENAADTAVQSAINTYPGGVICLGPGTWPEQLTISASNTILRGVGASGAHPTIIEPNAGVGPGTLTFNTVDWDSAGLGGVPCGSSTCIPLASIILVESATPPPVATPTTGVLIEDLQVNGYNGSANVGCGDDYVGVDFQDAGGTLYRASVLNVFTSAFGCQEVSGAIYAYNGYYYGGLSPASVPVTIEHTTVTGYQKNAITCDDPEEMCTLTSNTLSGAGPTDANAQNGIQVAYGAFATVQHNIVTGNSFTNGTGLSTNDEYANGYAATGILLYDSASGTNVSFNTVSSNQFGIYYGDDGTMDAGSATTSIYHNLVESSNGYGIVADGAPGSGDTVTINYNTINNEASISVVWGAPGILVDTGTFVLVHNHILGSSALAGSSNGASQVVCGPDGAPGGATGTPFFYCSSYGNISTAAIQGASESSSNPTTMILSSNVFTQDVSALATLGVLGGAVNLEA